MNKKILTIIFGITLLLIGIAYAGISLSKDVTKAPIDIAKMKEAKLIDDNSTEMFISKCKPLDTSRCVAEVYNKKKTYSKELFVFDYSKKTETQINDELYILAEARVEQSYKNFIIRSYTLPSSLPTKGISKDNTSIKYIEDSKKPPIFGAVDKEEPIIYEPISDTPIDTPIDTGA